MYTFKSRVRYSEVDSEQKMTFLSLLNYLQDSCSFQSEDLGIGVNYLKENQTAWVLLSWQIIMVRQPEFGENINVNTWPYEFSAFFGFRNFTIEDEQGRICAYANSVWAFMDLKEGRPAKLPLKICEAYKREEKYPMEYAPRKMRLPKEMQQEESFFVQPEQIDTNHHVNNGRYVEMAQKYLMPDSKIVQMRAEYRHAAVLGDSVFPFVYRNDKIVTVSLEDEQKQPYAIVEFTIE